MHHDVSVVLVAPVVLVAIVTSSTTSIGSTSTLVVLLVLVVLVVLGISTRSTSPPGLEFQAVGSVALCEPHTMPQTPEKQCVVYFQVGNMEAVDSTPLPHWAQVQALEGKCQQRQITTFIVDTPEETIYYAPNDARVEELIDLHSRGMLTLLECSVLDTGATDMYSNLTC